VDAAMTKKKILISGGGSGFGELAAYGLAKAGHDVIIGAQIWPQVTQLRLKAKAMGLGHLRVEKLDILDSYDIQNAAKWDVDILVNNAAIGISGPMSEIPLELLRRSFETNFFAPLALTQAVVRRMVEQKRQGKIVFVSSIGGLIAVPYGGPYATTKHALEALAGSMMAELSPLGIQTQLINPGGYFTGFNETEAESATHWMDDGRNYIKSEVVQTFFKQVLGVPENMLDPQRMADAMVSIIPGETGLFRNVVPKEAEDLARSVQRDLWDARIDLPASGGRTA
jgi:NAD(P)-dependent dehydrogenase (short-subunit alcohol dehydrogenase family)